MTISAFYRLPSRGSGQKGHLPGRSAAAAASAIWLRLTMLILPPPCNLEVIAFVCNKYQLLHYYFGDGDYGPKPP